MVNNQSVGGPPQNMLALRADHAAEGWEGSIDALEEKNPIQQVWEYVAYRSPFESDCGVPQHQRPRTNINDPSQGTTGEVVVKVALVLVAALVAVSVAMMAALVAVLVAVPLAVLVAALVAVVVAVLVAVIVAVMVLVVVDVTGSSVW